jgi:hypothetical protein
MQRHGSHTAQQSSARRVERHTLAYRSQQRTCGTAQSDSGKAKQSKAARAASLAANIARRTSAALAMVDFQIEM